MFFFLSERYTVFAETLYGEYYALLVERFKEITDVKATREGNAAWFVVKRDDYSNHVSSITIMRRRVQTVLRELFAAEIFETHAEFLNFAAISRPVQHWYNSLWLSDISQTERTPQNGKIFFLRLETVSVFASRKIVERDGGDFQWRVLRDEKTVAL